MSNLSPENVAALAEQVTGPVFRRGDAGLANEVIGQNLLIVHDPDIVVAAASESDIVTAVRFAAEHGLTVNVLSTGHGTHAARASGMLITTKRLDAVTVDADARTATVGAGVRWGAVVAAAAPHDLAPITGSSASVGVVGFLLGGGLGPLSRSHGFGTDWLREVRIVTADGTARTASVHEHPELFWAIRGGKSGLGVISRVTVELASVPELYAGSLFFDEPNIGAALRTWGSWSRNAPNSVTTSAAMLQMPPLDTVPEPLRGRKVLSLRFAYPGSHAEGERLAAPLRDAAPVYIDALGPLALKNVAQIHNDPDEPSPLQAWTQGYMLGDLDDELIDATLTDFGPDADSPFTIAEFRHLGGATARDVAEGSSIGGRGAEYVFSVIGISPEPMPEVFAAHAAKFERAASDSIRPEMTVNFMGQTNNPDVYARSWSAENYERLSSIRRHYDPAGLFPFGVG